MSCDVEDAVGVAFNLEIEAPILVDARLPAVVGFVKLLGVETGVTQVANQKVELLDEGLLHRRRGRGQRFDGALGELDIHQIGLVLMVLTRR